MLTLLHICKMYNIEIDLWDELEDFTELSMCPYIEDDIEMCLNCPEHYTLDNCPFINYEEEV